MELIIIAVVAAAAIAGTLILRRVSAALRVERRRAIAAEEELARLRDELNDTAAALAGQAEDLRRGDDQRQERDDGQAGAIAQVAASMDELAASVQRNTDTARETQRVAGEAREATAKSIDAATLVIAHMDSIREATGKVTEIVGVIDGIAFQTNLLALNAAVEAARAGEQGRGFAVVATEVRALSQRAAAAARDIKMLVGAAAAEVTESAEVVDRVAEAIADINGRVARVNDLMDAIVAAGAEQSTGIGLAAESIERMQQRARPAQDTYTPSFKGGQGHEENRLLRRLGGARRG